MLDATVAPEPVAAAEAEPEPFNPMSLIDRSVIAAAEARIAALLDRLESAKRAEVRARAAVADTDKARVRAMLDDAGALTIGASDIAHREARQQHEIAADTIVEVEKALATACMVGLPAARKLAHVPLARYAFEQRLEAARMADRAYALLAEANAITVRSNQLLQVSGLIEGMFAQQALYRPVPIPPHEAVRVTRTEAEELSLQADINVPDLA